MLRENENCPCGSGYLLKECCCPLETPITRRYEGFDSVNISAVMTDDQKRFFSATNQLRVTATLRKPQQLNIIITSLLEESALRITNASLDDKRRTKLLNLLQRLDDVLHAVKYHQIQFLFRLKLLTGEHLLLNRPVTGNSVVNIDDMPLRFEFEAFITRLRVTLDVMAKLASIVLKEKNCTTHGKLWKSLEKHKNDAGMKGEIYRLLQKNEEWITETREFRNAIEHDGELVHFRSFEFEKGILSAPSIKTLSAEHVCFRWWGSLFRLVKDEVELLFR